MFSLVGIMFHQRLKLVSEKSEKMESVKKLIMLKIPTSICNFRCSYCYLSHREDAYKGLQADMKFTPEQVATALSRKRMGGICFINACADGETLLTKNIDAYFKALVEEGHYLEIVTNLTITSMLDRILSWDRELLKRVEFKCSFHYMELKKRNLLNVFADNVQKIWDAGASANIEMTPSDEWIPYINEVKKYSMMHFGALPHISVARDNRTKNIEKLTNLSEEEFKNTWKSFDSEFWRFKYQIFGVKQTAFCYAGLWSLTVNLGTGDAYACYYEPIGNIFLDSDLPLPEKPVGKCPIAHCFNGHAFLTFGLIPHYTKTGYGDIRNRIKKDGTEWLQPELKAFFNTKLIDNNKEWSLVHKKRYLLNKRGIFGIRGVLSTFRLYQKLHDWKISRR